MEFTILFLAVAVVMVAAWWGTRTLALALFASASRGVQCHTLAFRGSLRSTLEIQTIYRVPH